MSTTTSCSLVGRVALVAGSTVGIGTAMAQGFAATGVRVWVHSGHVDEGQRLAEAIQGRFVAVDLAQPGAAHQLVNTIMEAEAQLAILVNNAGVEIIMPITELDLDTLDLIWRVNVRAPIELTHRLLPLLKRAGATSIINITSIHDPMPYLHNAAYSLSNAALAMFTKVAAVELVPVGIRVNNLAPGAVETDLNREVIAMVGGDRFWEWIPIGRVV